MSLDFILKWAPAILLFAVLLVVIIQEYASGNSLLNSTSLTVAIGFVSLGLTFYLVWGLLYLLERFLPFGSWLHIGMPYFAGIAVALVTVVAPGGSIFNPSWSDAFRLPAQAVLVIASRLISGPAVRANAAYIERRKEVIKRMKRDEVSELDDVPLELIDARPLTEDISLAAVAINLGKVELAKKMIERGAKIDEKSRVLAVAADKGELSLVKYLVERGAEPLINREMNFGQLPVWRAAYYKKPEVLKYLIETAVQREPGYAQFLFKLATETCQSELAKVALEHGANHTVDLQFKPHFLFSVVRSCYAEDAAARKQFEDFFELAQKLKVDFQAKNDDGKSILQYLENSPAWKQDIARRYL